MFKTGLDEGEEYNRKGLDTLNKVMVDLNQQQGMRTWPTNKMNGTIDTTKVCAVLAEWPMLSYHLFLDMNPRMGRRALRYQM